MVAFAALTSSVSVMEAIVASAMDRFHVPRRKATIAVTLVTLLAGLVVCLGYNLFYFELHLPNDAVGQVLDVMDYLSNYFLMPVVAISTCLPVSYTHLSCANGFLQHMLGWRRVYLDGGRGCAGFCIFWA